ncbi:MAG TPA: HEAT repeat domain-containing protein [Verrucomicrobiae bacterium]
MFVFWLIGAIAERHDPRVDGLALSDWLRHLNYEVLSPDTRTNRVWAAESVRKAGSEAVPLLLEYLAMDENSRSYKIKEKIAKVMRIDIMHPIYQRWDAVTAFKILGTNGQAAVPQLILMLEDTNRMEYAAMCLGWVRAPGALMIFTNLLNEADVEKRKTGLYGLGALGEAARPVSPQIIAMAQNETNYITRIVAIEALSEIGPAEQVIPLLTQITKTDTNGTVRLYATRVVGSFYREPEKARTALKAAEQDKDQMVRDGAEIGLKALEEAIATEELRVIWRENYP